VSGGGDFNFLSPHHHNLTKELGETTMDEHFVQGVVGGVLNRHKNRTLDKKRIATLSVEIAANIERATQFTNVKELTPEQIRNYNFIMSEMSEGEKEHLRNWTRGKAKDNPLSIEMWKGWDGVERPYEKEYLDHWTCEICDEHTHEVDYDYLGSGTNHLSCELKQEELQEKSDKIMKKLDEDFKDYDLSKSESNENSKVDMSATTKRSKK
jgi:alpha-galactosidase/6-phospho-beta-glucosidase family protein